MQKLTEMIDALVAEKTFSLEGVKAIEAVRANAEGLQKQLDTLIKQRDDIAKELTESRALAQKNAETIQQWTAREGAIAAREKAMTTLETKAAVNEATAIAVRECFGLVFRNAIVSESTLKSVPLMQPNPGGFSSVTSGNESASTTRTQT